MKRKRKESVSLVKKKLCRNYKDLELEDLAPDSATHCGTLDKSFYHFKPQFLYL